MRDFDPDASAIQLRTRHEEVMSQHHIRDVRTASFEAEVTEDGTERDVQLHPSKAVK